MQRRVSVTGNKQALSYLCSTNPSSGIRQGSSCGICGLVVECFVAIETARVRFPADAIEDMVGAGGIDPTKRGSFSMLVV